jgi:accessory colonization factor AcfC
MSDHNNYLPPKPFQFLSYDSGNGRYKNIKKDPIDLLTKMEIIAGPTNQWIEKAKKNADVIYSCSEYIMTDFIFSMEGMIEESAVKSLYLRPSAILVRPGNPKRIRDFPDLLKPGIKILIVNGSGQEGLWENMSGRQGNIKTLKALRKNIVAYARTSAEAKKYG